MKNILADTYRPLTLDGVIGQEHILPILKAFVKNKNIPHMLFAGKPGTGKTTVAQALARDLYGSSWSKNFYELNASDDRKLETIRDKVKRVAETPPIQHQFRIIFLDEADSLAPLAQPALRRIIEDNSEVTRFILSCNYPEKIIEPISDRLFEMRFKKIKPEHIKIMLNDIVKKENINITSSALFLLATLSNGSMRKALGILTCLKMAGKEDINDDVIYETFYWVQDEFIMNLVKAAYAGNLDVVHKRIDDMLYDKVYSHKEILSSMYRQVKESSLNINIKLPVLQAIGEYGYKISMGADSELQLRAMMCYIMRVFEKHKK